MCQVRHDLEQARDEAVIARQRIAEHQRDRTEEAKRSNGRKYDPQDIGPISDRARATFELTKMSMDLLHHRQTCEDCKREVWEAGHGLRQG